MNTIIDYSNKKLTELPILPSCLEKLYCYKNQITELPTLPSSLETMYCYNNQNNWISNLTFFFKKFMLLE